MTRTRYGLAVALSIVVSVLTVIGLIDMLEGGLALIVALAVTVAVRALSRVRIPRTLLIGMLVAVAMAVIVIAVLLIVSAGTGDLGEPTMAPNPLLNAALLNGVYRALVVVALVGTVQYTARLVRARRSLDTAVAVAS